MNPRDFLSIAARMHAASTEAEWRTSIGRSYYALFHVIIGGLSSRGAVFRGEGKDHGDLIRYLAKVSNRQARSIGQVLRDLRAHRNHADYELSVNLQDKQAELVYNKAKRAIESFDALPETEVTEIALQVQEIP